MPTLSSASTRPLADQLGGAPNDPPVATPRKRVAKAKKAAAKTEPPPAAGPEPVVDDAAQAPNPPPLPKPAERGGAKGTVAKFIRFEVDAAERLELAAQELRCSQTDLVKAAVAHYLTLLEQERGQGELEATG